MTPGKPLREYSAACQELLVVDDLLYAALGVDGRFVVARRGENGDEISFEIEPGLEGSLHALAREALPLCASAAAAAAFCEAASGSFEGGLVRHALAAEMEEMLHDWRVMVVQLEHQRNAGRLSLQSLWFTRARRQARRRRSPRRRGKCARATCAARGLPNALHADAARARATDARALTLRLLGAASKPTCARSSAGCTRASWTTLTTSSSCSSGVTCGRSRSPTSTTPSTGTGGTRCVRRRRGS